ncbi:MAG: hypothetical protein ACOC0A_02310, partial [Planctomycetota bacterium]
AILREEGADLEEAEWLARRTWGSPGRARQFREQGLPQANRQLVEKLLHLTPRDNFQVAEWVRDTADERAESSAERRQALQELLECVAVFYRDAAISAMGYDGEVFNEAYRDQLEQYAAQHDLDTILEAADLTLNALEEIGANANQRLALVNLFTQLAG